VKPLRVLPRADADVDEAADYYAEQESMDLALRFLDAVERAYKFIAQNPQTGSPGQYDAPQLDGVRRWPVPGFDSYLVFYRLVGEWIEIVRVLHGARDIERLFEDEV